VQNPFNQDWALGELVWWLVVGAVSAFAGFSKFFLRLQRRYEAGGVRPNAPLLVALASDLSVALVSGAVMASVLNVNVFAADKKWVWPILIAGWAGARFAEAAAGYLLRQFGGITTGDGDGK